MRLLALLFLATGALAGCDAAAPDVPPVVAPPVVPPVEPPPVVPPTDPPALRSFEIVGTAPDLVFDVPGADTLALRPLVAGDPPGLAFRVGPLPDGVTAAVAGGDVVVGATRESLTDLAVTVSAAGYRDTTFAVALRARRNCEAGVDPEHADYFPRLTAGAVRRFAFGYEYIVSPSETVPAVKIEGVLTVTTSTASCTETSAYVAEAEAVLEGTRSERYSISGPWVPVGPARITRQVVVTESPTHEMTVPRQFWLSDRGVLVFPRFAQRLADGVVRLTNLGVPRCSGFADIGAGAGLTGLDIGCSLSAFAIAERHTLSAL